MSAGEDSALERKALRMGPGTVARYAAMLLALGSGIWAAIELNAPARSAIGGADSAAHGSRDVQGLIHGVPALALYLPAPMPAAAPAVPEPGAPLVNLARLELDNAIRTPYVESSERAQPAMGSDRE